MFAAPARSFPTLAPARLRALAFLALLAALASCAPVADDGLRALADVQCPAQVPAWAANTTYAVGALVSYRGGAYQCLQAHTALDGWTPDAVPALWQPVRCATRDAGAG